MGNFFVSYFLWYVDWASVFFCRWSELWECQRKRSSSWHLPRGYINFVVGKVFFWSSKSFFHFIWRNLFFFFFGIVHLYFGTFVEVFQERLDIHWDLETMVAAPKYSLSNSTWCPPFAAFNLAFLEGFSILKLKEFFPFWWFETVRSKRGRMMDASLSFGFSKM